METLQRSKFHRIIIVIGWRGHFSEFGMRSTTTIIIVGQIYLPHLVFSGPTTVFQWRSGADQGKTTKTFKHFCRQSTTQLSTQQIIDNILINLLYNRSIIIYKRSSP